MKAYVTITADGEQEALRVDVRLDWKRASAEVIEALRASRRRKRIARAEKALSAA